MKKNALLKSFTGFLLGFGVFLAPISLSAEVSAPAATDDCAKELLLSYFPTPIVNEMLNKFQIPKDKWSGIIKSLDNKDKEVVKLVEQKASAMNPNPLKDPQQRQAAVKLFRSTLLEVFSEAMKENGVVDSSKYQAMLDEIQQQKAKKFAMCMDRQKALVQKHTAPQNKDSGIVSEDADESDDADDSDDSDDADDSDDSDDSDDADESDEDDDADIEDQNTDKKDKASITK